MNTTCDIIYPLTSATTHAYELMREYAEKHDIRLKLKFSTPELKLDSDIVFIRSYEAQIYEKASALNIKSVNSFDAMHNCLNKFKSYQLLKEHSIPTPQTELLNANSNYLEACQKIGNTQFILKWPFGSKGGEVWLVSNCSEFEAVKSKGYNSLLLQEYVSGSCGRDIRVWVAGPKASAAAMRHNPNSFKSNIACGASASKAELTDELSNIALRATKAVGIEIAAVDILIENDRYKVCEINGNAGFRSALNQGHDTILNDMFSHIKELSRSNY